MALDTQYIQLDISKQPTPQQVRLGQGDANATQLVVSIFDDGEAYSLTGYSVRLCMRLPRNGGYYDVDGTRSGNVATFDIDESYAASVNGIDGFGYVDILDGDEVICSTSRFQLVVLQCASDGVELSPQYSDAINDAIERTIAAAEAAEGVVLQDVPLMSATVRGGAQLGDGLAIDDGVLSVDASTVSDGTLPVSHGGTGATTAADARTGLSVYSKADMDTALAGKAAASHTHAAATDLTGQVPIANGGTGASTAAGALSSLGAAASSHTHTKSQITDFGSYLPLSGGTVTGSFGIESTTIDRDGAAPSSDAWGDNYGMLLDKDGELVGQLRMINRNGGKMSFRLGVFTENTSNATVSNTIEIQVAKDGTRTYYVDDAAAFRSAIGAAASSDRRLKSGIEPLGADAVEFVDSLKPCVYEINGERQVGLIAQDVHAADKWGTRMAFETRDGIDGLDDWERMPDGSPTWKLDYIRIIPPMVAVLQDATRRIAELEARVAQLEKG